MAPSPFAIAGATALSGVIYLVVVSVYRLYLHPLAKYPGPWLAKVTSLYAAYLSYTGEIHLEMWRAHEKYGDVVRFGPNRLLFRTSTALKDIYGFGQNIRKSAAYHQFPTKFAYSTHNAVDKNMHRRKRKLVNQAFTKNALKIWETSQLQQIRIMCNELIQPSSTPSLSEKEGWSSPKKMSDYALYLMSDIVSDSVFGTPFRTLTEETNRHVLHLVHKSYEWIGIIFQSPTISKLGLDGYVIPQLARARQTLRDDFRILMRDRINSKPEKRDIFSIYSEYIDEETGESFPLSEITSESLLLFGAGPDATSTSLTAAFFYLARNKDAYNKVVAEVLSTFTDVEEIVGGPKLSSCQYLRACIDEALRMNPVNGGALWREVISGGATIDGHFIPAGTDVGVAIYSIHHQADYYPDPFTYRPERWIASPDTGIAPAAVDIARKAWCPFSIGPRGCVGKSLALTLLHISLARVLFLYEMQLPKDEQLARVGEGMPGLPFPRNLTGELQSKGTFSSIVHGPMLEFRRR
ncbi:cytochrome P450 [Aspergillus pseudonomiae]|uniref:Cytochrome P450 n=1 Tax=Aspergillus pseudonomiae TaxID=1506151 RepID=A0A5N6IA81_9EURO|nr:cytochrome P450 [Aspergillus pseudonomiae]KAB8262719.1 cytochrome P450 [Aspergillus pseudonomiae]KAE8409639.1 cytochrome P450 [Aspergillus pseudonomiae]